MNSRFVLFSGSAIFSRPAERLNQEIQFLDRFVPQVLQVGGGFVVLLGDDDGTKGYDGKPRICDWIILRTVQHYAGSTTGVPRAYAQVVMSDDASYVKTSEGNRRTFSNLQQYGTLDLERIRREAFAGGRYRPGRLQPLGLLEVMDAP